MKTYNIYINYDKEESIEKAEKLKAKYENKGYTLTNTESLLDCATLTYTDKNKCLT